MKIEVTQDGVNVKVSLSGRLDTMTFNQFENVIDPYLSIPGVQLVLDVNDMDYVSSSGLRCFIKILKTVNASDGALSIVGMTPPVKEIFDMTGFSSLFLLLPSLDEVDENGNFRYYYLGKKI